MEDAQSAAGLGGQLGYMVCPRKVLTLPEAQKLKSLQIFDCIFLLLAPGRTIILGQHTDSVAAGGCTKQGNEQSGGR